jgi:hypothetical protein
VHRQRNPELLDHPRRRNPWLSDYSGVRAAQEYDATVERVLACAATLAVHSVCRKFVTLFVIDEPV